jgi:hypothetical protein
MKVTLHMDMRGPNGEEFERDAEIRKPNAGDWVMNGEANGARLLDASMGINYLVLTRKPKWRPKIGEHYYYATAGTSDFSSLMPFKDGDNHLLHFKSVDDAAKAMAHLAEFRREVLGYAE